MPTHPMYKAPVGFDNAVVRVGYENLIRNAPLKTQLTTCQAPGKAYQETTMSTSGQLLGVNW